MHTINIERVENGWVVRPHQPAPYGCCAVAEKSYVYETLENLQAALPDLLRTYHLVVEANDGPSALRAFLFGRDASNIAAHVLPL